MDFFAEIHRIRDFARRKEQLLEFTRLTPFRTRLADRLSGGMKQKLALACTLIHNPDVIFLDEPTTGVDPVSRRDFWKILQSLLGEGISIVLSTPYLDEAERCSRVALMSRGSAMDIDTPKNLRRHMKGDILEVVCEPVRKGFEALKGRSEILEVQAFGDRLHVAVRNAREDETLVGRLLESAGVTVRAHRVVNPTLENIFISLLIDTERNEVH
jgi:ABC-2 type transport system ATP-binding protein